MITVAQALRAIPIMLAAATAPGSAQPAPRAADAPPIGCASLANLRLLLRQAGDEAAAARLADPKEDHLGCAVIARGTVTAVSDHAGLNGSAYDCVRIEGTSVCQWTVAGTAVPAEAARPEPARKPPVAQGKPAAGKDKASPGQDKARR